MLAEDMPQIETRVVLVQDAGKNDALLKALEVRRDPLTIFFLGVKFMYIVFVIFSESSFPQIVKLMEVPVIKIRENCPEKSRDSFIKSIVNMVWLLIHTS